MPKPSRLKVTPESLPRKGDRWMGVPFGSFDAAGVMVADVGEIDHTAWETDDEGMQTVLVIRFKRFEGPTDKPNLSDLTLDQMRELKG